MNLIEAPSTNILLTYATMSMPIGMYPIFFNLHLKKLKSIIIFIFARKEGKPKTSSITTIDLDDAHFSI